MVCGAPVLLVGRRCAGVAAAGEVVQAARDALVDLVGTFVGAAMFAGTLVLLASLPLLVFDTLASRLRPWGIAQVCERLARLYGGGRLCLGNERRGRQPPPPETDACLL